MDGIALKKPAVARPARSLVCAPRMPEPPRAGTYRTPFDAEGDVVADCDIDGCGWHAMGPRRQVGLASKAHHKLCHSDQIGVVLLNQPRQ